MRDTIAIIGLGLMGGSLAKRIRAKMSQARLIAYDCDRETVFAAIDQKIIDEGYLTVNSEINRAKWIFIATPPLAFKQLIRELENLELHPSVVISDLCSIKACCEDWIEASPLADRYVGGHPICGSEHSGLVYASGSLFDQCQYYLMEPCERNVLVHSKMEDFLSALDIVTEDIQPHKHDAVLASISHMPHAISFMMSHMALGVQEIPTLGKSFKEMTRIAKSAPELWTEIFKLNQEPLIAALQLMKAEIEQLCQFLAHDDDKLLKYLQESREKRITSEQEDICSIS